MYRIEFAFRSYPIDTPTWQPSWQFPDVYSESAANDILDELGDYHYRKVPA